MAQKIKKLYCFVDETGQDAGSKSFVVVVVTVWDNIQALRSDLLRLENKLVASKKWHKLRHNYRLQFINAFLQEEYDNLLIFYGNFRKPASLFYSTIETIKRALIHFSEIEETIICIDGLDIVSAKKMTGALRTKYRRLRLIKGQRDESEVLIRLADRWAGCLRLAFERQYSDCQRIILTAQKRGWLKGI